MIVFTHNGWNCVETPEGDGDGFTTPHWHAERDGERRIIQHSRFHFTMTAERFAWLVDNDFPQAPGVGPWTNMEIDTEIGMEELQ